MPLIAARRALSADQALDLVPSRAPHVKWSAEPEEIRLIVRRSPGGVARFLGMFFTLPPTRAIQLDRPGSDVWRWCDGRTPVRAIADRMAEASGWPVARAREAVLRYLGTLSARRLVGFAEPPVAATGTGGFAR